MARYKPQDRSSPNQGGKRTECLPAGEFIRRFLLHVLQGQSAHGGGELGREQAVTCAR